MTDQDIQGTVTDADGNPVEGATVALMKQTDGNYVKYALTGTDGKYKFESHPDGNGTSDDWHLVCSYKEDGTEFNSNSRPFITSSIDSDTIDASGGIENTVYINGFRFKEHRFNSSTGYQFTVSDTGKNGLVQYEIIGIGNNYQGVDAGTDISHLEGEKLRKVDPFFDPNVSFEHTSKQVGSNISGWSSEDRNDDTVTAEAAVPTGTCYTSNGWEDGVDQHYQSGEGRMPTIEEYANEVTIKSGCGHDDEINWSSTKGSTSIEHWASYGDLGDNGTGVYPKTESDTNNNTLRQVADDDLNRPDPVIVQDDYILGKVKENNYPYTIRSGPTVEEKTYNLELGSGTSSDKIDHTGKQVNGSLSGIKNQGEIVVRYPDEPIVEYETWDGYSLNEFPSGYIVEEGPESDMFIDDERSWVGDKSLKIDGSSFPTDDTTEFVTFMSTEFTDSIKVDKISFVYNELSSSNGGFIRWLDGDDELFSAGTNNPQVQYNHGNGVGEIYNSSNFSQLYDAWRKFIIDIDWRTNTFDLFWKDLEGDQSYASVSNLEFVGDPSGITKIEYGYDGRIESNASGKHRFWIDNISFKPM